MVKLTRRIESGTADATVTLRFQDRQRSRMRVTLDNGVEAGVVLPRGQILRHGDLIDNEACFVVEVQAALEKVSSVTCADPYLQARIAYHLGNRHVSVELREGEICYLADHVLDEMVRLLGGNPTAKQARFEPESGAYHHHGPGGH